MDELDEDFRPEWLAITVGSRWRTLNNGVRGNVTEVVFGPLPFVKIETPGLPGFGDGPVGWFDYHPDRFLEQWEKI